MKWPLFNRLCKSVNLWNSHTGLAPEASNIPNEIQVLNWGLIWSLHYSSDEQIIEMITEIKFAILNLLLHSWEEPLTCFDCNWQMKLTSHAIRAACQTHARSMEKQAVARSGFSLVWRRRNQLLAGYWKCGQTQLVVFHIMLYHMENHRLLGKWTLKWYSTIKIIFKCNKMFRTKVELQAAGKWTFLGFSLMFSPG